GASVPGQYRLGVGRAAARRRVVQRPVRHGAARIDSRRARAQADELAVFQSGDGRRRQKLLLELRVFLARAVSPGHRRVTATSLNPAFAFTPLKEGLVNGDLLGVFFQKLGESRII